MAGSIPGSREPRSTVAAEISDLFHRITQRLRRAAGQELEPRGVTWAQVRALRALAGGTTPMRMSELAQRLRIARRSATSIVDELSDRDLVQRRPDPSDRRGVAVVVTPGGDALLADLSRRRRDAGSQLTSRLSHDELVTLRDLLRRLDTDD